MRFRGTLLVVASLFCLLGSVSGAQPTTGPSRPVALTGTDGFYGPGLGTGIKFASFHTDDELFCNPVMNNRGDIVFRATITGTGITADNDKGLWLYQNGRLAPLAREGDPVPGMPGVYFDEVSEWAPEPVICDAGKVLFYGFLQGAGITSTTEEALFWGDSQSIKLIAQQWVTELPDRPGVFLGRDLVSKSMLTVEPMAMTADGRPVVRLGVHPGGGSNDYFLANIMFTPATGEIQTLAYGGDPLPGNASINQMGNALVSDGGIPAAWLEYDDLAGWGAAIFSERSGALASIYDEDEPAPGGEKYGPLHHERVAVNGDGHVAFFAWGEDQWGYDGRIFSEGPFGYDIPFLIAETGESAPGTGNGTLPFLYGILGQLGHVIKVELVHDLESMNFHGLGADEEALANLLGGVALGEQLQDFTFPWGQHGKNSKGHIVCRVRVAVDHHICNGRTDVGLALCHSADGLSQLLKLTVL